MSNEINNINNNNNNIIINSDIATNKKQYTIPKEIIEEEMKIEENNNNHFKKISTNNKKNYLLDKKRFREFSPSRKDPLNLIHQKNQTERTYKEIMLEQKKEIEEKELIKIQKNMNNNNKYNIQYNKNLNEQYKNNLNENETIITNSKITNNNNNKYTGFNLEDSPTINYNEDIMNTPSIYNNDNNDNNKNKGNETPSVLNEKITNNNNDNNEFMNTPELDLNNKESNNNNEINKGNETPERIDEEDNLSDKTVSIKKLNNNENNNDDNNKNNNNVNNIITNDNILTKYNIDKDIIERNKPLTDEDINNILPGEEEGYSIIPVPESYKNILNNYYENKNINNENNINEEEIKTNNINNNNINILNSINLTELEENIDESKLTQDEIKQRNVLTLILKIKNGLPNIRKNASRQITEKAKEYGAELILSQLLPLIISPTIDDYERHLLIKLLNKLLFKLDYLIRPYSHKILNSVLPLLNDENNFNRNEGKLIISNLSKAAGLSTMISILRPDLDNPDEGIRNLTAKAFAVISMALGLKSVMPFIKAVNETKKSLYAKETGIKIIQQVSILMGNGILPYLKNFVDIIYNNLKSENQKIRTLTGLTLSCLAESSFPYGIDAFGKCISLLFEGLKQFKGKNLLSYFRALGNIILLMDNELAVRSSKLLIPMLKKNFNSNEENFKKVVLIVLKNCLSLDGIESLYVKNEIFDEFFNNFWNRRVSLDKKNYKLVINATIEIAKKISGNDVINKILIFLKDENEIFRKMTMECLTMILLQCGVTDIDKTNEKLLIDGMLFNLTEQTFNEEEINTNKKDSIFLNFLETLISKLENRVKPYLNDIVNTIQFRFSNKNPLIRKQSADIITKLSKSLQNNAEVTLLQKLCVILNENMGEEFPEVLASILKAMYNIINCLGLENTIPPIKDIFPKFTPILKNHNENVEINVIKLIGLVANNGASYVSPKEWMRICFDLLEFLRANRKNTRRQTVNTFGYIAKNIGPQEVLMALLNNLKVQERKNRICTTVAIAIIAENCGPFTVIPSLMNEFRVRDTNVQNGVLKSINFLFEYIGEMSRDYIYSVIPLLTEGMCERDLVHRQIACNSVKHLGINLLGLNCEDALIHLLNYVWPNIFETSPHMIMSVTDAIEGLRVGLGVNRLMNYVIQGLFHPARRIRNIYWRIFNIFYVGAQDDLCSCYPTLPEEGKEENMDESYQRRNNKYNFDELNLFI